MTPTTNNTSFATTVNLAALDQAATFLSAAEEAISKATSKQFRRECWGCTNHSKFHKTRHHLYRECPNKDDQENLTNFKNAINAYYQARRQGPNNRYQPQANQATPTSAFKARATELTTSCQDKGFPNEGLAQLLCQIDSLDTNKTVQTSCLASLNILNLGKRSYHENIYKKYPKLVLQYAALADLQGSSSFGIGGFGGSTAASITHIITYCTPWTVKGKPFTITFALGDSIACNTILSYPLFKALNMTLMFENNTIVSSRLGETFPIDLVVPHIDNQAPIILEHLPLKLHCSSNDNIKATINTH